ncbi:hypothetical protein Dimus_038633 [Dionaea muscipula]
MKRSTRTSRSSSSIVEEKQISVGNFSTKFSLPSFVRRVDKLTPDQRAAIQRTGFGNLLRIHNQFLNKNLLVELMDRWDPGKKAFVLPPGEITITTMDVAVILGLRGVGGDPVNLDGVERFSELEEEYGAAARNRKISLSDVEERLQSLGELANEDFVRAFLLFTFGTFLFPNSNGKVDSRYLCFLKDLQKASHFAWGAAVVEDIFYWLSRRKEEHVQYVGGCLILLQVWSYEHIATGRPNMVDRHLKFPRACRWESSRSSNPRQRYTALFDELEENQITWILQLTAEESEMEIVKEILEPKSSREDLSALECYSSSLSVDTFKVKSGITSGSVVSCAESSTASYCLPGIQEEQIEHPSGSMPNLVDSNVRNEIHHEAENWRVIEAQNVVLMKEVDELRKENALLRKHQMLVTTLQEENEKLRTEVQDLKRENESSRLSTSALVARLEHILEDYEWDSNSIEDRQPCTP